VNGYEGAVCPYCHVQMVWLDCEYPFWYHPHETPRHGEWVPAHGCVADFGGTTPEQGCREQVVAS
jgi:hypothetical protein